VVNTRIFGNFVTAGDGTKCRLKILRDATNWDARTNEKESGTLRGYVAAANGFEMVQSKFVQCS
jgi:hypothetical protein